MPAPFGYRDLAEVAGSWPIIPTSTIFGTPALIPGTVDIRATILGIARETVAGYTVNAKSFNLYVDGVLNTINFIGADPHTLQDVIDRINTVVGATVAFRDNGYLLLKSDTSGEGSSLRVSTDVISDIFVELGLFSETEAFAGDLSQARHVDPKKQVTLPGQLTMAQGESFKSDVFNRAVFQMGVNSGRNEGLLSKKRVAFTKRVALTPFATAGAPEGYQFSGGTLVYTGELTNPTTLQLEDLFAVLDPSGKELVQETEEVLATELCTFGFQPETGLQRCTINGAGFTFADGDEEANIFVQSSNAAMGALQNVPLKILSFVSATQAIVQNIDPLTGDRVDLPNTGSISTDKVQIRRPKVRIDGVYDTQGGSRIENVQTQKTAPVAPTRVEKNNRIVIVGADFITDGVIVGDRVDWTGHLETDPYDNNAEYRVDRVIDAETIEVVNADWSSALLNPDLVAGAGTIEITTDGQFVEDPFIQFEASPQGAIPVNLVDDVEIVYLSGTTYRDATDNPSCFSGGSIRFGQEVDQQAQAAIIRLAGQSVSNINDILHGDYRINLEDVDYRLNEEHYTYNEVGPDSFRAHGGRHRDIRPDKIDMFPEVSGQTLIVRGATGETGTVKLSVNDAADQDNFSVGADGRVYSSPQTTGVHAGRFHSGDNAVDANGTGRGVWASSGDVSAPGTGTIEPAISAFGGAHDSSTGGAGLLGAGGVSTSSTGGRGVDAVGGFGAVTGGDGVTATGGLSTLGTGGTGGVFTGGDGALGTTGIIAAAGGGAAGGIGGIFTGSLENAGIQGTGGVGSTTGGVGASITGGGAFGTTTGGVGGVFTGGEGTATGGAGTVATGGSGVVGGLGGDFLGTVAAAGVNGVGGPTDGAGVIGTGGGGDAIGGDFFGTGSGSGVKAWGASGGGTGHGVEGQGGNSGGAGIFGTAASNGGVGVQGTGGPSGGTGGVFTGGTGNSIGVTATGLGTAAGLEATGGATGGGGIFTAGATSGIGITGTGTGSVSGGFGVLGQGSTDGGTNHTGVVGIGGSGISVGVSGVGSGTGPGLAGSAGTGDAIQALGGAVQGTHGARWLGNGGVFRTPTSQLELITRHQQNLILVNSQITIGLSGAPTPDVDSWNLLSIVRNGNGDYTLTLDQAVDPNACSVSVVSGSTAAANSVHWEYEWLTTTTIRIRGYVPNNGGGWVGLSGDVNNGNEISIIVVGRPSVFQS